MPDETTPPALETKDLPYAAAPAAVPHPDRIGYEVDVEEDRGPAEEDRGPEPAEATKTTRGKATDKK